MWAHGQGKKENQSKPKNSHSHSPSQPSHPGPDRPSISPLTSPSPSQTHRAKPTNHPSPNPSHFQTQAPHRTGPSREDQPLARPARPARPALGGTCNQPTARAARPKIVPLRTASRSTVRRSCQTPRALIGWAGCEWHGFGLIFLVWCLFCRGLQITQHLREASRFPSWFRFRQPSPGCCEGWDDGTNLFREGLFWTVYGSAV